MKKFYFLLASSLLTTLPIVAQEQDGPIRTDKDAKEIFTQDFEADWDVWSSTPVDTIDKVNYYKSTGTAQTGINIYDGSEDWKIYGARDTMLILMNGVVTSDDGKDIESNAFGEDSYTIVLDDDNQHREALEQFGTDGGNYYFRYQAGLANNPNGSTAYSNGVTANYRRNLFVRGLPIEDETSYRLTLYVKAKEYGQTAAKFYADVMRGYFHSEKPFSMGLKSDNANYMYNNTFEYEKSTFTGDWEKVTFMTYYLNDSIADQFVFNNGYWWTDTEWEWEPEEGMKLHYVQQPDKFFVRLSFASDSTTFLVDNISLTKSWIGGVEHNKDLLRVDFGYETNMDELAAKAKEKTNIAAVQVPGEYFTVWGLDHETQEWWDIEISSAEYHGDGYMYMWTKPIEIDGIEYDNLFEGYDSVLVSFKNPVDREDLCLNYSGSKFPKALDVDWIKAGKLLPDFSNEISTENPYIGQGVYSMKNLPPVLQGLPYEDCSFGLDGSVRELTLRLSRAIAYDNTGESSKLAFLRVTKSGVKEIWTVKEVTDSTATFERPATATGKLEGEYKFEFLQLKGESTDYGDPIIVNWEFGPFDTNPQVETVLQTDFRSETSAMRQIPGSLVSWNSADGFVTEQPSSSTKCDLLYIIAPEGSYDDCGFYLSSRSNSKFGHLYYGLQPGYYLNLKKGKYAITFKATYWNQTSVETRLYVFENKFTEDIAAVQNVTERTLIGTFKPTTNIPYSDLRAGTKPWPDNVETFTFVFEVPSDGNYVIDCEVDKATDSSKSNGTVLGNFSITGVAGLSFAPVTKFNQSLAAAKEKLAAAEAGEGGKYLGQDCNSFSALIDSYEGWQHTAPSVYAATTATIDKATAGMQLRMDTVDLFGTTYNKVIDKLSEEALADYTGLATYKALEKLALDNEDYPFADNTTAQITDMIGQFNDGIAALDARKELIDKFVGKLGEMEALLSDSLARKGYDEYAALEASYAANKDADLIAPSDEELQAMYDAICADKNGYVFRCDLIDARTRQIKELFALNEKLGSDFGGNKAALQAQIEALTDGDDNLEAMLRAEAIWHITEALKNNDPVATGLDISAVVPNYFMYTAAQADVDMRKNSSGKWVIITPSTTAVPNWMVSFAGAYGSSGAAYPGSAAMDWEADGHVFIGGVHFENNTTGSVQTIVEGLPVAYYNVKGTFGEINVSNSYVDVITDSTNVEIKCSKGKNTEFGVDSVYVTEGSKLDYTWKITGASGSGHCQASGVKLVVTAPDATYDYSAAAAAAKAAYDEIVTFVDGVQSAKSVNYIGLDGVQMNAPKAGQIAIRKTDLGNGRSRVEKVLVK